MYQLNELINKQENVICREFLQKSKHVNKSLTLLCGMIKNFEHHAILMNKYNDKMCFKFESVLLLFDHPYFKNVEQLDCPVSPNHSSQCDCDVKLYILKIYPK